MNFDDNDDDDNDDDDEKVGARAVVRGGKPPAVTGRVQTALAFYYVGMLMKMKMAMTTRMT